MGLEVVAFDGRLSKKLPPLNGGCEVIWGAEGAAFAAIGLLKLPRPENAGEICAGGDPAVFVLGKLNPPKASVSPPKASCLGTGGDVMAAKEGSRAC